MEIKLELFGATRDLNNKDIQSRKLNSDISGSVIVEVLNRSPLTNLLSANDIIIEVQKQSIKKSENLNKIIEKIIKNGEKTLLLTIISSNNQRRYLGVKIN